MRGWAVLLMTATMLGACAPDSRLPPVATIWPERVIPKLPEAQPAGIAANPIEAASTSAPPAEPATTTGPRRIELAFTGDVLTHRVVNRRAQRADASFDYRPMFADVAPLLRRFDLAVCNFEQPIAPPGTTIFPEPLIMSAAPALAQQLVESGFDRCSTANNHAIDRGAAGIDTTLDVFDAAGLGHSGTARHQQEAWPTVFDVGGVAVAHLAYTYGVNGLPMPKGQPWRVNLIDPARIVADAAAARQAGAALVIVTLHWGLEGSSAVTASQRAIAEELTASEDIDLIIGHHAHVLQPIEQINGTWVLFGLGNVLSALPTSDRWPAQTADAVIAHLGIHVGDDGKATVERPQVIPTWVDKRAGYVIRLTSERDDRSLPDAIRRQLDASRQRTHAVLGDFFDPAY